MEWRGCEQCHSVNYEEWRGYKFLPPRLGYTGAEVEIARRPLKRSDLYAEETDILWRAPYPSRARAETHIDRVAAAELDTFEVHCFGAYGKPRDSA